MPIRSQFTDEQEWLEHLRMYFAGQALAGMSDGQWSPSKWITEAARTAYALADAMLEERAKRDA